MRLRGIACAGRAPSRRAPPEPQVARDVTSRTGRATVRALASAPAPAPPRAGTYFPVLTLPFSPAFAPPPIRQP
ncbi:hypothetical protein Srut_44140 [Streptomyces rutgersensis]|nr:hypothetical protein Srut_44140 [Streptomyces rutgersensis]